MSNVQNQVFENEAQKDKVINVIDTEIRSDLRGAAVSSPPEKKKRAKQSQLMLQGDEEGINEGHNSQHSPMKFEKQGPSKCH